METTPYHFRVPTSDWCHKTTDQLKLVIRAMEGGAGVVGESISRIQDSFKQVIS